jgi:peptide/nickel transport system permease protein
MRSGTRIAKRFGAFAVTVFGASALIFLITAALPGDVAQTMLGTAATPQAVAALRAQLGLDQPLPVQYLNWVGGLLSGNLGVSQLNGDSVAVLLGSRAAVTVWLVGFAMVGSLLIAVPAGMLAAAKRRSWTGTAVSVGAQVGMAIPVFWAGIMASMVFAVWLHWLPANGYVALTKSPAKWASHLVLPVFTLSAVQAAVLTRYVRSAFVEVLGEDYFRTARAVGWTPGRALWRHGLRNAAISLVTVLGLQTSSVLVGAIVVESVFNLPGLGSMLLTAVAQRDLVVVRGTVMLLVIAVLAISAVVDMAYLVIDPRQRTNGRPQ